ncbi:MAG: PEP-CTERM sorting domain-containing protein [Thiobacillus sp.]
MHAMLKSSFVALALAASQASAAPFGSLVFDTPNANVLSNQAIDVWVTFTLDSGSSPLVLTGDVNDLLTNGTLTSSEEFSDIPTDWLTIDSGNLNTYYGCSGTFTNVCDPAAYSFDFNLSPPDSINFLDVFNLQPGQSTSYKFGTFNPVGGNAPAGTYEFISSGLTLELNGTAQKTDGNGDLVFYAAGDQLLDIYGTPVFDGFGDPVLAVAGDPVITFIQTSFTLGDTTNSGTTFIRNVTAVPEPETYAMLLAGLGLIGWRIRGLRG